MSKMSNLAIDIEEKKKYTIKVGEGVKCNYKEEAQLLAYALADDGKKTKLEKREGYWWLEVTEVEE